MRLFDLLLRFGIVYIVLMLLAWVVLGMLNGPSLPGLNMAILISSAIWACSCYGQFNGRPLEPAEVRRATLGMWGIDLAWQTAEVAIARLVSPETLPVLAGVLLFVGPLHLLAIYITVRNTRKMIIKALEKQA